MSKKEVWYRFTFANGYVGICKGMSAQERRVNKVKHSKRVSKTEEGAF